MSEETGISVETGKEMILLLRDGAAIGEGKLPGRRESFHSWEKLYRLAGRKQRGGGSLAGSKEVSGGDAGGGADILERRTVTGHCCGSCILIRRGKRF